MHVLDPQASDRGSGHSSPPVTASYQKLRSETVPLRPAEPRTPGRGSPGFPSSASACLCILSNYCLMQNA